MKEYFPGFYLPTEEEFKKLWSECLFVFDTNALLYVYRYPDSSRNMLINILKQIKDRIWIPHQVGMEYHLHLHNEISNQHGAYENIQNSLEEKFQEIEDLLKKQASRHVNFTINTELIKSIEKNLDDLVQDINKQKESHPNLNITQNELAELFNKKVGNAYSQDKLNEIFQDGKQRYPVKTPPGFKDHNNKKGKKKIFEGLSYEDQYGDLVLWYQVIDKAIESKSSIILITDDVKEDWWRQEKGKTVGPHPELIKEFKDKTNNLSIYMYQTERFIEYAKKYLNLEEEQSRIDLAVRGIEDIKKADQQNMKSNPDNRFPLKNGAQIHLRKSTFRVVLKSDFSADEVIKSFRSKLALVFPEILVKVRLVEEEQEWIFLRVTLGEHVVMNTQDMKDALEEIDTALEQPVIYTLQVFERVDKSLEGSKWNKHVFFGS
ncbi:PIN-like domain-containing protein [Priestia megaterium]|uniref:PIN-like domain-containing protein n=1 Tax=Priestia megaterium TaxID=1404 RepID=UPI001F1347A7|nr:PIN-like domain-containing protein [Priestia megaterium]UMZ36007.1 PIN domain-containing protein [Priestia megaterium]